MIVLKANNEIVELVSNSTAELDVSATFVDITSSAFSPSTQETTINSAGTTTIIAAPAPSTQRQVKYIAIRNRHASTSNTIYLNKDIAGTNYRGTPDWVLLAGESVIYLDGVGWKYYAADGTEKLVISSPNNATYRTILCAAGSHVAGRTANTYGFGMGDPLAVTGTGTLYPLNVVYIDSADFPTVNALAAKLNLRAQLFVNDVAPTGNFTFGLHPVTRPGTSGGAALVIYTIGAAVAGSTFTINAPGADSSNQGESGDFALPANGYYVIGVVTTATVAASSHLHMSAILRMRNN